MTILWQINAIFVTLPPNAYSHYNNMYFFYFLQMLDNEFQ